MQLMSLTSRNAPSTASFASIHRSKTVAALLLLLVAMGIVVALTTQAQEAPKPVSASAPAETTATNSPWRRIVMVGASASAGFVESEPLGGPKTPQCRLNRYVDAALLVPHEPVKNVATALFFFQPEAEGRRQIEQALKAQPTLVVGIDFLFWFCYGDGSTDEERLKRFEKGLKMLEAIPCPLIVGDLPDASGALNSMLEPEQIPSAKAMAAANRRLTEWAAGRSQVIILSLSGFMRAAMANQALTIHGNTLPDGKTAVLLQSDKLHPSPPGCAVLALAILDAFQSTQPTTPASEIRWNPKEVFRLVFNNPPKAPPTDPAKSATLAVPPAK